MVGRIFTVWVCSAVFWRLDGYWLCRIGTFHARNTRSWHLGMRNNVTSKLIIRVKKKQAQNYLRSRVSTRPTRIDRRRISSRSSSTSLRRPWTSASAGAGTAVAGAGTATTGAGARAGSGAGAAGPARTLTATSLRSDVLASNTARTGAAVAY